MRQHLRRMRAKALGEMREFDRRLERRVRIAAHHRAAAGDEFDGAGNKLLALHEIGVGVFLRLDPRGDHRRSAAILDDVIDLALQCGSVDFQVAGEGRQRHRNKLGFCHAAVSFLARHGAKLSVLSCAYGAAYGVG